MGNVQSRFWACRQDLWRSGAALGLLGALLLGTGEVHAQQPAAAELELLSSNLQAGLPGRYAFVLPSTASADLPQGEVLQLVFAADLDVDAFQRLLQLCYLSDRSNHRPARSRCLESIPARISVKVGPGEDTITIEPQQLRDGTRAQALWVDLINPNDPGRYAVLLRLGTQPAGQWTVRIEQPSYDSPGPGD